VDSESKIQTPIPFEQWPK